MAYEVREVIEVHLEPRCISSSRRIHERALYVRDELTFFTKRRTMSRLIMSSASRHSPSISYVCIHSVKSMGSLSLASRVLRSPLPSVRACNKVLKWWSRSEDKVDCIRSIRCNTMRIVVLCNIDKLTDPLHLVDKGAVVVPSLRGVV